jgi:hypothetical protein
MSRPRLLTALLALALTFALAACGGDDGNGDEDEVTEVMELSATGTDPADCTRLQTQAFMEQTTLETGETAVKQCEEDAPKTFDDPDSVEVSNVSVDGSDATADIAFTGGSFDGSTLSIALVKEGDQWKVNEITDIPEFDFEGFVASFREIATTEGEIPPQAVTCIADAFNMAGAEQMKAIIVEGDASGLNTVITPCIEG